MPKGNEVGLSFMDAALAAQAELEGSPEPASTEESVLESVDEPEAEQSTDNSEDSSEGLFTPLFEDEDDTSQNNPTYVEDSAVIVIDGETVTLEEAKKGFMRHEDYTRKTQELADQRRSFQNAVTLWEALENDPITTLRTLNARLGSGASISTVSNLVAPRNPGSSATSVDAAVGNVDDLVNQKVAEKLASDPRIKAYETQQAKALLDDEFSKIEADWGITLADQDKLIVLQKAQAMNTTDLPMVFAGLMSLVSRKKAQRQGVKQSATLSGRGFVDGEEVVVPQEPPADFKDAIKQAMRDLRVQDLQNLT